MLWIKLCFIFLLATMRCAAAMDQYPHAQKTRVCEEICKCETFGWKEGWSSELRAAVFHPTSSKFRKIYSEWEADYQMEVGKRFTMNWSSFFNVSWLCKHGHSLKFKDGTRINVLPVSLGIKGSYCINPFWEVYGGVGATYTFLHIWDDSHFVKKNTKKQSYGLITKIGAQHTLCNGIFIDFFADYLYLPFHFAHAHKVKGHFVDVGGWKFGLGIGYGL